MTFDVWFARNADGQLYYTVAEPGDAPVANACPAKSVAHVYQLIKVCGHEIAQVGIADIDMIRI